jgi:hypothetical protein
MYWRVPLVKRTKNVNERVRLNAKHRSADLRWARWLVRFVGLAVVGDESAGRPVAERGYQVNQWLPRAGPDRGRDGRVDRCESAKTGGEGGGVSTTNPCTPSTRGC